ncbi:hypothetical protein MKW92_015320 [Papaver armeniacum]|nr:hypothetical protein MKW92_015320 [Papaver armeniacum]
MKFAVKTSILSKRWRYIWTSLPTLQLNSNEFRNHEYSSSISQQFVEFVDSALILRDHKSDIEKFHICWFAHDFITDTLVNHLNTWISVALNRNVVELSVELFGCFDYRESDDIVIHHFPCNLLFNCSTMTMLELKVNIEILKETEYELNIEIRKETEDEVVFRKDNYSKITFPKSIDLPCLRVLKLESLDIDNGNKFLRSNIPPLLEYLSIKGCQISMDNSSNMDWNCIMPKKIKLNVPLLQTFVCEDYTWREYSMENISSLVCGGGKHYLKLPELEKELYATRVIGFLKEFDVVELQLSPWILENLFSSNTILNEDLTEHRISFAGNTV